MCTSPESEPLLQRGCMDLMSYRRIILLYLFCFSYFGFCLFAEEPSRAITGLAWQVQGTWQAGAKGAPVSSGDALQPGSLLQAGGTTLSHSIIIFLADGRRVFYECFTLQNCARGFRLPSLYRTPDPAAVEMLTRIHASLIWENEISGIPPDTGLPREEALAVLDRDNRVRVEGLVADLPTGRYTYTLKPLNDSHPSQSHFIIEKTRTSIIVPLPGPGIYNLRISDDLNTPRIDLFVAAITPIQATRFVSSFHQVRSLMKEWNESGFAWPIHDFQRAYLLSLMRDNQLPKVDGPTGTAVQIGSNGEAAAVLADKKTTTDETHREAVTAEPGFFPKPGVLDGDTPVVLRSATPGSAIHFTVDNSEPMATSPVYAAPIMVKGTGLTIKSFASAPGRSDSAVVTAIYRIVHR